MNNYQGSMFLSIVVPVFNVESYIESCFLSLVNQRLENNMYEIIFVNDGSFDGSHRILMELKEKYSNFHIDVLNKSNGGVSSARNKGLQKASGKYVMFVDGDDKLKEQSLNRVYKYLYQKNVNPDVVHFNIVKEGQETANTVSLDEFENGFNVSGQDFYLNYRRVGNTRDTSCTSLYKRSFLINNNIYYNEKASYLEDGEFLAKVFSKADNCVGSLYPLYVRTIRPGSATTTKIKTNKNVIKGTYYSALSLYDFKIKERLIGKSHIVINQALIKFVSLPIQLSLNTYRLKDAYMFYRLFKKKGMRRLETYGVTMDFPQIGKSYNYGFIFFVGFHIYKKLNIKIKATNKRYK